MLLYLPHSVTSLLLLLTAATCFGCVSLGCGSHIQYKMSTEQHASVAHTIQMLYSVLLNC